MSQRERQVFRRPREGDLEKSLRSNYTEYEEWRNSQVGEAAEPPASKEKKPEQKKFKLGRLDLIFVVLGVLGGLLYQSCKAGR